MSRTLTWVVAVVTVLALVGGGLAAVLAVVAGDGGSDGSEGGDEAPRELTTPPEREPGSEVPPDPALAEFYSQSIEWEICDDNECGTLTVPVDYREPDGETIDLALEKVPASDQDARVGSLVVNPGGPGAPGTTMAESSEFYFRPQLLERVDVVAFDPRGTGDSDPVDCLSDEDLDAYVAQDPTPDDAAETRAFARGQADFFAGCVAGSDEVVGHVSTIEAARDMDVLRAALGEQQLRYLGFSYGTTLGSTYAELFPEQVGEFVLDGATDPTLDFRENSLSQAAGFETALRSYVQDCVDQGGCFLGGSVEEGLGLITDLLDQVERQPLETQIGRELAIGNAFYGLVAPLYSEDNWTYLDQGLEEALGGDGTTLLLLSDSYGSRDTLGGGYTDNSLEAISAINCLDDPSAIPAARVPAEYPAFEEASPTFGRVFAWGLAGCRGIQVEAVDEPLTIRAEGAAPILVLGTTRDPATPYEEAVALAGQLESGVLVSRDGDGHTAYNKANDCIDEAVEGYLLDGTVPEDGLSC